MVKKKRKPSFLCSLTCRSALLDRKLTRLCVAVEALNRSLDDWCSKGKKGKNC